MALLRSIKSPATTKTPPSTERAKAKAKSAPKPKASSAKSRKSKSESKGKAKPDSTDHVPGHRSLSFASPKSKGGISATLKLHALVTPQSKTHGVVSYLRTPSGSGSDQSSDEVDKDLFRSFAKGTYQKNASRNLYRLISRKGHTIPIDIKAVVVPVKIASRKVLQKPWPVLQLSDWVKACFEHYGGMLKMFPKGLGKGFDASLLGKWLAELLPTISPDSVPENCRDILKVLTWGMSSANKFFHSIYNGKLWLSAPEASEAVVNGWQMMESYGGCARLSAINGWNLWYLRPKAHMICHLMCHA
ncbi:unnamed protein product [Durusdinium trenchii]|uniref:Uncharacterized protein n=1 Tax=Durusdinium trenchii TaxID=1381693 RepID=A0ABP0Q8V3_9DINO